MSLPNPNYPLALPLEFLSLKILDGYSQMGVIVGDETGIGKSRIALRTAELVNWRTYKKKWTPDKNVFFSMTSFKDNLFNSSGKIFIIEEAEIELGSDDWQSISNRWFSRIKDTQRIKGNLYILVLPLIMALARKHRRRINFIFDVKNRGYAKCYKIKKRASQLLGDELSKLWIGDVNFNLPDCDMQFDILDIENKKRIEIEQGEMFDKEIEYRKLMKEKRMKKLNKIVHDNKDESDEFIYRCHACRKVFTSKEEINKVITCSNCGKKVYINEQNLIGDSDIKLTDSLNDCEDEDND